MFTEASILDVLSGGWLPSLLVQGKIYAPASAHVMA